MIPPSHHTPVFITYPAIFCFPPSCGTVLSIPNPWVEMGNSQTKETRSSPSPSNRRSHQWGSAGSHGRSPYSDRHHEGSRSSRSSRPDLSIIGISGISERDVATLEHRRENKQEREARRLEKERMARIKERERSMKEEHVDGGYLVTQGVYVGTEDFNKAVVRQLMVTRL